MREANLFKYYFMRYFFLAFALMQITAATLLFIRFEDSPKNRFAIFVLITFAIILLCIHLIVFAKVKRVALGKKRIEIISTFKSKNYDWHDVKELKLLPFFNLYSMKLKGKKNRIYFLPAHDSEALFGLFAGHPDFLKEKLSKAS